MANLDEMLEFAKHWDAYCTEEHQLTRLKTCPPVVLDNVDEMERRRSMFLPPEHVSYDYQSLAELGGMSEQIEDQARSQVTWGWWLRDEAWEIYCGLVPLLGTLDKANKHLDDVLIQQRGALDADEERARAAQQVSSYEHANETDRQTLVELKEKRDSIAQRLPQDQRALKTRKIMFLAALICFALGVALGIVWSLATASSNVALGGASLVMLVVGCFGVFLALRPLGGTSPLHVRKIREDFERANIRIKDTQDRIDRREREIKKLTATIKEHEEQLLKPFEKPLAEAREAIESAEMAVLAQYIADLSERDDTFDEAIFKDLSFDEAMAVANQREWALLEQWMDHYKHMLPFALEHAQNMAESELVWLEGHAPYGKRYWDLTPQVVSFMQSGRTDQSDVALQRVCAAEAERAAQVLEADDTSSTSINDESSSSKQQRMVFDDMD